MTEIKRLTCCICRFGGHFIVGYIRERNSYGDLRFIFIALLLCITCDENSLRGDRKQECIGGFGQCAECLPGIDIIDVESDTGLRVQQWIEDHLQPVRACDTLNRLAFVRAGMKVVASRRKRQLGRRLKLLIRWRSSHPKG